MSDLRQTAAICRTIQTLSRRSRVVICQSDLYGLLGVAAGADAVGTGWHMKQRVCCPATYQQNDPAQVRRTAEWHTFEGLAARLHHTLSDILQRADRARAESLYTGPISTAGADLRHHHLGALRELVESINGAGNNASDRVPVLRNIYEFAVAELDDLANRYGRLFAQVRIQQVDDALEGLRTYATDEGVW
jgi:hypothetical protein